MHQINSFLKIFLVIFCYKTMRTSCGKKTGRRNKELWWKDWDFVPRMGKKTIENVGTRQPSSRSSGRPSPNYAEECTDEGIPETQEECPAYAFTPISKQSQPTLPTPAPEELSNDEFHSMTKACEELLKDFETSGVTKTAEEDWTFENFVLDPEFSEDIKLLPYLNEQWRLMNPSWKHAPQKEEHKFAYCAKIGAILGC